MRAVDRTDTRTLARQPALHSTQAFAACVGARGGVAGSVSWWRQIDAPSQSLAVPPLTTHHLAVRLNGSGQMRVQDGSEPEPPPMTQGMVNLLPAGTASVWQWDGAVDLLHIDVDPQGLAALASRLAGGDVGRLHLATVSGRDDPELAMLGRWLADDEQHGIPLSQACLEAVTHLVTAHLLRHYVVLEHQQAALGVGGLPRHCLAKVHRLMESEMERPLSIQDLAAVTPYSPHHFCRLFRRATGESPHRYLMRTRIERAKRLLRESAMPLSEMAVLLGFADQSHFIRVFFRHAGRTPGAWRREAQR
jgi:AraC family transcriptional regulator